MSGILWRLILASIAVVLCYALVPPFVALLGFSMDANLWTILRVCVAGLAIYYVLKGRIPYS
jgi:hypothetical protein